MDELSLLRQMRSDLPHPGETTKQQIWNQILDGVEDSKSVRRRKQRRIPRAVKACSAGIIVLVALALSPAGTAIADQLGELFGSDEAAIERSHEQLRQIDGASIPNVSEAERREITSSQVSEIAEEAARAAGGERVILPPGVVVRIHPHPLDAVDLREYASFCAKLAELRPEDHSCDLNLMVQSGELPPGDFTKADLNRLFPDTENP